ncbi:MAG: universal stress protein UspA [Desulfobulbaceae bacterium BRH_c16a]|nr:MAG: universal stress protein UspA [Desulfobulbaceae bacterium BRH_c16a]
MERFSTSLLGQAETLLLATDGSHFSDGAIQEAIFLGQACGTRVVVLHVVPIEAESTKAANSAVMQRQQEMAPHLDQIRKMAQDSGVEIEVVVVGTTSPEKTIVEQARLRKADAILMGRHGKTGRLSQLVGTMTAKVIGQGFPRVLVVPKDFLITGAHVLLTLDGSSNSLLAAQEALSLGRTCTTLQRLTVISVVKKDEEQPRARQMVDEFCARCREENLRAVCDPLVLTGKPAKLIKQTALERRVDMILIGGRGKSFMAKMLMGNVTEKVIGKAHCAVLVVTA